jgi:hypothetical protein
MPPRPRAVYIALEHIDFIWDADDLPKIRELWIAGRTLEEMAAYLHRPAIEVFMIVLDQLDMGNMGTRKELLFGRPPRSPSKPYYPPAERNYPETRKSPEKKVPT